jgi:hypothetical protein
MFDTVIINNHKLVHNTKKYINHIRTYNVTTKKRICDYKSILEWGGGYGGLAYIIKKKNPRVTYTIIDIPCMSYFQYVYLTSMGIPVNVFTEENQKFQRECVNIISLPFIEKQKYNVDLFISTWALSESGKKSHHFVHKNKLLQNGVLLAHNKTNTKDFPHSKLYLKDCHYVDIDEDNRYVLR